MKTNDNKRQYQKIEKALKHKASRLSNNWFSRDQINIKKLCSLN